MRRALGVVGSLLLIAPFKCAIRDQQPSKPYREGDIPAFKSRSQHLQEVKSDPHFDVIIIGGGCNGAGVLLDSSSRGLKALLIEANDFGNGASSKSTKMIHGGMRYLQSVFVSRDSFSKRRQNYGLVKEALQDRQFMIQNATYMNKKLKFVIPYTTFFEQIYYYVGTIMYHTITLFVGQKGKTGFTFPYFCSQEDMKRMFPYISNKYQGGIIFQDGQFNDAQMLMAILLTSTVPQKKSLPANILNQAEFINFLKDQKGKIKGVVFKDKLTSDQYTVSSKYVVNCTGTFADKIRQIDNPSALKRILPVAGSHITYDKRITMGEHGLIINSDDGRVFIVVPWLGKTVVGTTEKVYEEPVLNPTISIEQKKFIYDQMHNVFDDIDPKQLMRLERSTWTGLRPLVMEEAKNGVVDTKRISRRHVIEESQSGLISLMGGKWTIYRQMGQDVVDKIMKDMTIVHNLPFVSSQTNNLRLVGDDFQPDYKETLVKKHGKRIGQHMFTTYGSLSSHILTQESEILDPEVGVTKQEIKYIVKYQMPTAIEDVVLRRVRAAFLDRTKVDLLVDYTALCLGQEYGWSQSEREKKIEEFYNDYEQYQF